VNETTNSAAAKGAAGAATDLPTAYAPVEVEGELYERWVKSGYFTADADSEKEPFTIVIPPPNVTGSLHVGHALNQSIQDAIIRRKRMQGFEALYLPGMDHAGIATQNAVERELAKDGLSRHDLGREAFVQKVWDWKAEYGGRILGQQRRLGISVDWSRERFTMDEGLSKAVQTIFNKLYDDGLIYRAERIINWCPRCPTSRWTTSTSPASWCRSATATARTRSWWRPAGPRRCSATPRWPCIRTTSATGT
jgi:valyl-tRNA synthetase